MTTLHDLSARSNEGADVDLAAYAGQVALVVNPASRCGSIPQHRGRQELHDRYAPTTAPEKIARDLEEALG